MRYKFTNDERTGVTLNLAEGETVSASVEFFDSMSDSVKANQFGGGIKNFVSHIFSGEKVPLNTYSTKTGGKLVLKSQPGFKLRAIEIDPDNSLVVEKRSLVALGPGLKAETIIVHKINTSVYGKQGFTLIRVTGYGTAFIQGRGGFTKCAINDNNIITIKLTSFVGFQRKVMLDFRRNGLDYTVRLDGKGSAYLQQPLEEESETQPTPEAEEQALETTADAPVEESPEEQA